MLTVKMMSNEDLVDSDPAKGFTLIQLDRLDHVTFSKSRVRECQVMVIQRDSGGTAEYDLEGNVYILSESGKTVASHGC